MIRKQVFLREDQTRDIRLWMLREGKPEAAVIRDLLDKGIAVTRKEGFETTGDALLRLVKFGESVRLDLPSDLSTNHDKYLYDDKK